MNKGFKHSLIITVTFIMCIILSACGKNSSSTGDNTAKKGKKVESSFKKIGDDEIVVCSDYFDMVYPPQGGMVVPKINFVILAGEKVDYKDIEVKVVCNTTTGVGITPVELDKKDKEYAGKILPSYKAYEVEVKFETSFAVDEENIKLESITVKYNNYIYDLQGKAISIDKELPTSQTDNFKEFVSAYDDVAITPNKDGIIDLDHIGLDCKKGIEITGVELYGDRDMQIDSITAEITGGLEVRTDRLLLGELQRKDGKLIDGGSIKVKDGEKASLNIDIKSEQFAKLFTYTTNPIVII